MQPIKHIKLEKDMKVADLVAQMSEAGFGARKIGLANKIAKKMFSNEECKIFLGLAGAMVPAGMKQIIIDLIKQKKIHALVTTGANLTHDLIEALDELIHSCNDVVLLLVGGGPQDNQIRQLIKDRKLDDKVILQGRVLHETVHRYYILVDVFASIRLPIASSMQIA